MLPYHEELSGLAPDQPLAVEARARLKPAITRLQKSPSPEENAILSLCGRQDDIPAIAQTARNWRARYPHMIVIGAGGSGLSGRALALLKQHENASEGKPSLHVLDNLGIYTLEALQQRIDLRKACVFIVSKSGGTAETHAFADVLLHMYHAQGLADTLPQRALVMTEETHNPIRALAQRFGIPTLTHDANLGGRFSLLSAVGLIPAAFMGLDIAALRRGAADALTDMEGAAAAAASLYAHAQQGKSLHVLFPYSERLWGLAQWWRQCWAESLGKGGKGTTPYIGFGPADQHSQLQLYLDGPKDKCFTLLLPQTGEHGSQISEQCELPMLRGKSYGAVVRAMQQATRETLLRRHCPVRSFTLPQMNEETLGALIMRFMLEILFTAHLSGVTPFGQPAVEESKALVKEGLR